MEETKTLKAKTPEVSDNGQKPIAEIEKAIKLVELKQDLMGLEKGLANLQQQAIAQAGAIQYIHQKITSLEKVDAPNKET